MMQSKKERKGNKKKHFDRLEKCGHLAEKRGICRRPLNRSHSHEKKNRGKDMKFNFFMNQSISLKIKKMLWKII
jgi:hypothetical protein